MVSDVKRSRAGDLPRMGFSIEHDEFGPPSVTEVPMGKITAQDTSPTSTTLCSQVNGRAGARHRGSVAGKPRTHARELLPQKPRPQDGTTPACHCAMPERRSPQTEEAAHPPAPPARNAHPAARARAPEET